MWSLVVTWILRWLWKLRPSLWIIVFTLTIGGHLDVVLSSPRLTARLLTWSMGIADVKYVGDIYILLSTFSKLSADDLVWTLHSLRRLGSLGSLRKLVIQRIVSTMAKCVSPFWSQQWFQIWCGIFFLRGSEEYSLSCKLLKRCRIVSSPLTSNVLSYRII